MTAAALCLVAALAAEDAVDLRYDLKPGDHLVYRETLRRQARGPDLEFETRVEWISHVVVAAEQHGRRVVGFQRNRTAAELLRHREKGHDRVDAERPRLLDRLPPARFAEGNLLTEKGDPDLPWSALREATSELLPALHELERLPPGRVRLGDTWTGGSFLRLTSRAAAWMEMRGERALRIDATGPSGGIALRTWVAERGTLERLEFDGGYSAMGARIQESLSFELMERKRGEDPRSWAGDPEVRQGAFAALLASSPAGLDPAWLYGLLPVDEDAFARQVLALAYHCRLPPPPLSTLDLLLGSADPRVRVLAVRLLPRNEPALVRPFLDRARADPDSFVREAARERPPRAELAPSVFPHDPPGTTLRPMTSPGFEGWPYVVHVPEDYRGDEPFPLLVSLSGGPGRAMLGLPAARNTVRKLGYLVVFPEAADLWWTARSTRVVATLLDEVLRRFNVDTNRVYISGSSNGGTGAFLYATLWPHRLAAGVSLMGAGLFAQEVEPPLPANLGGLPLLFVHGDKDEVISPQASEETAREVRRAAPAASVDLRILRGRAHDIVLGNDDDLTPDFLARHVRNPFPARVKLAIRSLDFPRRAWLEVLAKKSGVAEVEGQVDPRGEVQLRTRQVERLRLLLRRELVPSGARLRIRWNGKAVFEGEVTEDAGLLARSGQASGDPYLGWSMEIVLTAPE